MAEPQVTLACLRPWFRFSCTDHHPHQICLLYLVLVRDALTHMKN